MTAALCQRAPHEDRAGSFKDSRELADGIEQENAGERQWPERGTPREGHTGARKLFGNDVEALRLARREDKQDFRT